MKLWTIQKTDPLNTLFSNGILRGDWRRVWKSFKPSYRWLCQKMEERGILLGGRPPIWAWTEKPDLRQGGYLSKGEKGVRMELLVPDNLILLSNFEAWHFVLNNWNLPYDVEDADIDKKNEKSWERIFELDNLKGYNKAVQATLPFLKLEWVIGSTFFIARG